MSEPVKVFERYVNTSWGTHTRYTAEMAVRETKHNVLTLATVRVTHRNAGKAVKRALKEYRRVVAERAALGVKA